MAKASITQRGGDWAVRWRDLTGRQFLRKCPTKRAAEQLASTLNYHFSQGTNWHPAQAAPAPSSLWGVIDKYVEIDVAKKRGRTPRIYIDRLERFQDFIEEAFAGRFFRPPGQPAYPPVSLLSRALLEDFQAWLGRPENNTGHRSRSDHTNSEYVAIVERCWSWADESERWPDLPRPRRIERVARVGRDVVAPTYAEWDRMLVELHRKAVDRGARRQSHDPLWAVRLGIWMRFTGMRRRASLLMPTDAIDLKARTITIPSEITKGGYGGRTIPLHPDLGWRLEQPGWLEGPSLFRPPASETPPRQGCVSQSFGGAWRRAGVPDAKWFGAPLHCCRAMIETAWAVEGCPDRVVDMFLGHKPAGTGRKYYMDRARQWPAIVEAVGKMPPLDLGLGR